MAVCGHEFLRPWVVRASWIIYRSIVRIDSRAIQMLNQRVVSLPGLDNDRLLTNAQNLESALDEWHESGLDTSSDIPALQAFANRWRKSAMLIALRALRRVEDLRLAQQNTDSDTASETPVADDAGADGESPIVKKPEKKRLSTPEYYEQAIADWAASGLDASTNAADFTAFATKWRATATLIALRADRRVDQLRTLEAHGRELEVRQMMAAEAQRQREESRVAEAARAFQAAQQAARGAGDNNALTGLGRYEQELGDWSARGLDKAEKVNDLVDFATKWRQDATLVALRAERRVDHLRALEFDARGGRVRTGTAADRRPVVDADQNTHQEGMAAASAQAAAASYAYGGHDLYEPAPAARPVLDRAYSVTENFNFALDDWQNSGLDDSTDIVAFHAFVKRWKNDATLIALRAERRIETLQKQQAEAAAAKAATSAKPDGHLDYIARHPIDLHAAAQAAPVAEVPPPTSAESIATAVLEWDGAALEFSGDRTALAAFSHRWRQDAEIIALRADRRIEELNVEKQRLEPEWQEALQINTVAGYEAFQAKHPHSQFQKELSKRLLLIDEEQAWRKTVELGTVDAYRTYLQAWPSGTYNREARVGMMGGAAAPVPVVPAVVPVPVPTVSVAATAPAASVGVAVPASVVQASPSGVADAAPVVAAAPVTATSVQAALSRAPTKAPRRTALVWFAVLAMAAAVALLAYFFLPQRGNVAVLPKAGQVAAVTDTTGNVAQTTAINMESTTGSNQVAAPKLRAPPDLAAGQFTPSVEEPIPNKKSTIAVGPAMTPARLDSAMLSSETESITTRSNSTVLEEPTTALRPLAPLNDWNVATAPHTGWSVPLAPLNDWNVATAPHTGWSVPLAPLNDWNVATAPHTGWSVPLAPLNDWNVATAPHIGWSVPLAPLNDWNVATVPHSDWRVRLAAADEANGPTLPHVLWTERLAASNDWNGGTQPHADWAMYLAKANEWNTATLPHQDWPERLARRAVWNQLVAAPHLDWRPYLAATNEWNVATAPHAGWMLRLRAANAWNGPVRPHLSWPEVSSADDAVSRLQEPQSESGLAVLSTQVTDTRLISTASIPVPPLTGPVTVAARDAGAGSQVGNNNPPKPNRLKRREAIVEPASAAPVTEPAELKSRKKRATPVDEDVVSAPASKRAARPAPEPEPELEAKPRPRPLPQAPVAAKVELPRKEAPKPVAVKEVAKPVAAAAKPPNLPNVGPPVSWLRDIFLSRN
jgi:hypothetical protein